MNVKLKSYLNVGNKIVEVDLYGYSSRSIPGLEINGLGKRGKLIKEKINFILNRYFSTKNSLKKYVISIESILPEEKLKIESIDLELPIFLIYLSLLEVLPVKNLDHCWSLGRLNVDFEVTSPFLNSVLDLIESSTILKDKTLIAPRENYTYPGRFIAWEDILKGIYKNNGLPKNDSG